jgi:hypothetical protein
VEGWIQNLGSLQAFSGFCFLPFLLMSLVHPHGLVLNQGQVDTWVLSGLLLVCRSLYTFTFVLTHMPQTTGDVSGSPKSILASSFPDLSVTFLPSLSLPLMRKAKAQAGCTAGFPCLFAIKIMFVSSTHSGLCEHHLKCSQVLLNKGDQSGVCCQMILRLYRLPTVYLPK